MKVSIDNVVLALLALAVLAAALGFAWHDAREAQRRDRAYELAQQATADAERRAERERFEGGSVAQRLDLCLEQLPQRPALGIGIHRERIDALYRWGPSLQGLRRYSCDAGGVSEAHVDAPFRYQLLESDPAALERVVNTARAALDTAELIEVVLAADGASVVLRKSSFASGRATSSVEPADTAAFPWISSAPPVLALPAEHAAIHAARVWPTRRWLHEHTLAFQAIAATVAADHLPRVTGLDLLDERMTITFQGLPADENAAFEQIEIDRYGVASWPAPYVEPPGFSCAHGVALDVVRQKFVEACQLKGCRDDRRPTIATYGCSGGPDGDWTIRLPRIPSLF